MTKQEAIEAMKAGAKVTHRFFEPQEWITMEGDLTIITEEGYTCPAVEFWGFRKSVQWETDWSIRKTESEHTLLGTVGEATDRNDACSKFRGDEYKNDFLTAGNVDVAEPRFLQMRRKANELSQKVTMEHENLKNRKTAQLGIGIVMWRLLVILLVIPCLLTDIIGLLPMIIMTKMDEDNSPYPYIQYLVKLW